MLDDNKMEFRKIMDFETDLEANKVLNILQPKKTCELLPEGNYINTI